MEKVHQILRQAGIVLFAVFFAQCGGNSGGVKQVRGTQLLYTSAVTVKEVNKLADFLIASNFANENEITVQLDKSGNTYLFRMVVREGIENDPEMVEVFKTYAESISEGVFGGKPVDFHVCDKQLQTRMVVSSN